jgi:hypothetical protein
MHPDDPIIRRAMQRQNTRAALAVFWALFTVLMIANLVQAFGG